jgi:UDP-N-acetylmuramoyl-L-alanyl-D-glutamate--2,6-diaminopimelate ligase
LDALRALGACGTLAASYALQALHTIAQQRQGRLWCVVGCGGERDASKRPLMARVAQAESEHLVLTSDNPRGEDPRAILAQMQAGLSDAPAVHVQVERQAAIAHALAQAQAQDVVLIAGKGHETSQEVAGQRLPFSDTAVARDCLAAGVWS